MCIKAFSSMPPVLILSLSFLLLFFRRLCLYFIFVHSFFPRSWLFSLFLFLFFLADLVSLFSPSPLCGCLFCLCLFFHRELSLSSFLICLFAGDFVLPGSLALCTLMSTLTDGFGLSWGREGGRCGKTAL